MNLEQAVNYMVQAFAVAKQSKAERRKTGAIIVHENLGTIPQIISEGCNGTRPGTCNQCEDVNGITLDYDTVIHAERNAIEKMGEKDKKFINTLFVTRYPCPDCAELIRNSGISKVYYCETSLEPEVKHGDLGNIETIHIPKNLVISAASDLISSLCKEKFT